MNTEAVRNLVAYLSRIKAEGITSAQLAPDHYRIVERACRAGAASLGAGLAVTQNDDQKRCGVYLANGVEVRR